MEGIYLLASVCPFAGVSTHPVDLWVAALGDGFLDQLGVEHLDEVLIDKCEPLLQLHFGRLCCG